MDEPETLHTVTYADVVGMALGLPGVEHGTSYGTPGLKVRGKFLTRLRDEDGALVVKVGTMLERDFLLSSNPRVFFITDHYREYPAVLVRIDQVSKQVMRELLVNSWRRVAPKRLVAQFEAGAF